MLNPLAPRLHLIERGWLHGNCVVAEESGGDLTCVDTGYWSGVEELAGLVARATGRDVERLRGVLLTHVHSDHAGGVAELVERSGARVLAHPEAADLVERWDPRALWLDDYGQHMPRFRVDGRLEPGDELDLAGYRLRVLWTPGHAMGGISFHLPELGMLIAGDALWEDGFGLLNPWVDGEAVFERTAIALDNIGALDLEVVVPGHGAPITDVEAALERARSRLDHLRARPDRLRHQVVRNYVGFALLADGHAERERLTALAERAAAVHPPLPGDASRLPADELAREAVEHVLAAGRATGRRSRAPRTPRGR